MSSKYSDNDKYTYPDSSILVNKLSIREQELLERLEFDYVALRSIELTEHFLKIPFRINTLQEIHKKLFGDIYEWAGEFRTVDISKGDTRFCNIKFIKQELLKLFMELEKENFLQKLNEQDFCKKAAYYMGEINAIHPFREGNGRTQREFINQLALNNNYGVDWSRSSPEDILEASIRSFDQDYDKLAEIINRSLFLISS
jgi:cell filamentation protein